jgi:CRISPR-associated endonuclease Cas1
MRPPVSPLTRETFEHRTPRNGVLVVDGYGVRIAVNRGHLVINDGIGRHRRELRFPRVNHGLRRLIVLGHSGTVSLEASRWLDRVNITFTQLDVDGRTLVASSNQRLDDARLRRAQVLAAGEPAGFKIVQDILDAKLAGQQRVLEQSLHDGDSAASIGNLRQRLAGTDSRDTARDIEAAAAYAYFGAWSDRIAIEWTTKSRRRVPDHWHRFDSRRSPLNPTSSIHAADPINALLNYLYALAEIECRRACLILGLDPGLGLLHSDAKSRDSLALDLIEVVRPDVDRWLIELLSAHRFSFDEFTERDDGHCRVLAPLTHQLGETMPIWERAVAPWAEFVAHCLADASTRGIRKATPLTSASRRTSSRIASTSRQRRALPSRTAERRSNPSLSARSWRNCVDCGTTLSRTQSLYCNDCWPARRADGQRAAVQAARERLNDEAGRSAWRDAVSSGRTRELARAARALGWEPDDWDRMLAEPCGRLTARAIQTATGLSSSQASRIRRQVATPHPRHWSAIARLVGLRMP